MVSNLAEHDAESVHQNKTTDHKQDGTLSNGSRMVLPQPERVLSKHNDESG